MTSIGHRYNCSRKVISCFLSKYSLVSPIKFINILSDEELNYIITSYKTKNETMTSLADKYNVSRITIQKLLSSQNIESVKMSRTSHRNDTIIITNLNQKYDINKDFFKQINTHEKAYILGYLYADGYILTRSKKVEGFGISLSSVDHDILEKMCIEFKTSIKRIKTRLPKDFYNPYIKKIYTSHEQSRLDISIKEMGNDLIELGCVPNKSLILKYPTIKQVPLEFQNSFILGYFDGDGCISLSNNKYSI